MGGDTDAVLIEDWHIYVGGDCITIPRGFRSDGASIPRLLWPICGTPMQAPRIYAAICHDYIYCGFLKGCPRWFADLLYFVLLVHFWRVEPITDGTGKRATGLHARVHNAGIAVLNGIALVCAWTEWSAIRIFGCSHWTASKEKRSKL